MCNPLLRPATSWVETWHSGEGWAHPQETQFHKKKVIGLVKNMIFSHQAKLKEDAFNIVKGTGAHVMID